LCQSLVVDITMPWDNFNHYGGVQTTISSLIKDNCGNVQSGVAATATFSKGDDSLNLIDDGTGADQTPGDGIYSAYWTSLIAGSCTITVTGTKDGYDTGTDNVSGEIECKTLVVFITAPSNNASMTGGVETVIPVIIKDNCENVQVGVSAIATFNNGEAPLTLVDDGTGADGNAGDGVYTVFWTPSIEGSFTMTVTATKDGYDTGTDTISGETLCQSLVVDITMPWDNFNHYGGVQTTISSLIKDNCGNVQSEVAATATFSNGDESLNLVDDGTGADQTAGDGIYSVYWTPLIADSCTITVTGVKEGCSTGTDTVSGDVISSESYTPPGEDVEVEDTESGTSLTFDNVEVAGETTVNITEQGQGPPPPSGFKLHPAGMYYEINTTAEFNGMVEICINYDDTDLTPKKEEKLVLKVYEEGTWVPLTTTLLDTDANKICAETSHFSFFALTYDMSAEIVFTPSVFNLKSNGNYITCHIEMYDGYDVYDIDQTKDIVLEYDGNTVIAEESPRSINNNKLMVKFDRQAVFDLLSPDTYVDLTVKGTLTDGNYFEGTHNDIWVQD
ncbi:hypothetical protein KKB18_00480, partial [bacterium]|nr:hypothetical protein [bacterium]